MTMKHLSIPITLACLAAFAAHAAGSIPEKEIDEEKILYGVADSFTKAAEVDYMAVVKATPEYDEIKQDKIEPGTARYFILMSQAGDRAIRAVTEAADAGGYDLVTQKGYLGSLSKPIASSNITKKVLAVLEENG